MDGHDDYLLLPAVLDYPWSPSIAVGDLWLPKLICNNVFTVFVIFDLSMLFFSTKVM